MDFYRLLCVLLSQSDSNCLFLGEMDPEQLWEIGMDKWVALYSYRNIFTSYNLVFYGVSVSDYISVVENYVYQNMLE